MTDDIYVFVDVTRNKKPLQNQSHQKARLKLSYVPYSWLKLQYVVEALRSMQLYALRCFGYYSQRNKANHVVYAADDASRW